MLSHPLLGSQTGTEPVRYCRPACSEELDWVYASVVVDHPSHSAEVGFDTVWARSRLAWQ
jgi:hypothetical protein